jgi:hypothetical protein
LELVLNQHQESIQEGNRRAGVTWTCLALAKARHQNLKNPERIHDPVYLVASSGCAPSWCDGAAASVPSYSPVRDIALRPVLNPFCLSVDFLNREIGEFLDLVTGRGKKLE